MLNAGLRSRESESMKSDFLGSRSRSRILKFAGVGVESRIIKFAGVGVCPFWPENNAKESGVGPF